MDSIVRIMQRHKVSRDTDKRVLRELSDEGYIRKIVGKGSFITSSLPLDCQYKEMVEKTAQLIRKGK